MTTLDGVVSFVVIIVVGGIAGVPVVAVVVIDELLTSVVTPLLGPDDAVVVWDTLPVFLFTFSVVTVASVVGIAVEDPISRS